MNIQPNYWQRKLDTYSDPKTLGAKISKNPTITNRRIAYLINHLSTLNIPAERVQPFFESAQKAKVFSFSNMTGRDLSLLSLLSTRIAARDQRNAVNLLEHGFPATNAHLIDAMDENLPEVVFSIISKGFAWPHNSLLQEVFDWSLKNNHQAVALELIQRKVISNMNSIKPACQQGQSAVVYWFLNSFSCVDDEILTQTLQWGHADIAEMLLTAVGVVQSPHTKLLSAIKHHGMEGVFDRLLPLVDPSKLNLFTNNENLLIIAAKHSHKVYAEKLIKAGADVTARKENGPTALFEASKHDDSAIVDLLLAQITDPEEKKRHVNTVVSGQTALDNVTSGASVRSLLCAGAEITSAQPVIIAARSQDADLLPLVLSKIPEDKRETYLTEALFAACRAGRVLNTKLLLREGAKVTSDAYNETALHKAAVSGVECVNLILAEKATSDFVNAGGGDEGTSALGYAAGHGIVASARRLIEAGANVTQKEKNGRTALHAACECGNLDMVELLIASVPDASRETFINQKAGENSALDLARQNGHEAIVKRLLQEGAVGDLYTHGYILKKGNPELLALLHNAHPPVSIASLAFNYNAHNSAYIALCVHIMGKQDLTSQSFYLRQFSLHVFNKAGKIDTVKALLTDEVIDSGVDLRFLYEKEYSDKKIRIGTAILPVNLRILRRRCSFFSQLPPTTEHENEDLTFDDIDPEDAYYLNLMIEEIYSGGQSEITHDNFKGLQRMADRFGYESLLKRLEQWLSAHPECENWKLETLCNKIRQLKI